ncbi:MAG: DNA-binding response regulator [Bacteroidota bacterium]|nr:DNA-binding response regulator [Bacteroidota bacterium]
MISAVLIDDEPLVIKTLEAMLKKHCPEVNICGTADSASSGKQLIESVKPELVFLDIEMPFGNGFDLLKSFSRIFFEVIFVTAFDRYALNAFKYSAVDYVLKPIDKEELKTAVVKADKAIKLRDEKKNIAVLIEALNKKAGDPLKIALPTMEGLIFVLIDNIVYCKSDGNYTKFHFKDGSSYLVSRQLNEYDKALPENTFFRVHNEYIVNLNHVSKYLKGRGGQIILETGEPINVSVRKKDEFLKKVFQLNK